MNQVVKAVRRSVRSKGKGAEVAVLSDAHELALLRKLARLARIGAWELELPGRRLTWTEQVYRLYEVDPAEYQPTLESSVEFVAPEARPRFAQAVRLGIETGAPWDLELPLITARGQRIWVRAIGEPEMQDSRCLRIAGTFEDITGRRQAREALAAASNENRKLAHIVEHFRDPIFIADARDGIEWINARFTRVTGWTLLEIAGHEFQAALRSGDAKSDASLAAARALARRGEIVKNVALQAARRDGTTWSAELHLLPIRDEAGAPTHTVGVLRDVSAQHAALVSLRAVQDQARAAAEWLDLAAKGTGFGFAYRDLDRAEGVWDAQMRRIFALSPDEPPPSLDTIAGWVVPEDRAGFLAAHPSLERPTAPREITYRIHRGDNGVRWIRSRRAILPMGDKRAPRLVMAVLDVTDVERNRSQRRLVEERLALAAGVTGLGTWEIDLASRAEVWSDRTLTLYGLPPGSPPPSAREWRERFLHPDDAERVLARSAAAEAEGRGEEYEFRIRRADGAVRWLYSRFVFGSDPAEATKRLIGVTLDVTERKDAEAQARDTLARLELATERAGIGTFTRDFDTERGQWDAIALRLFGLPGPDTPNTEAIVSAVHPDDRERFIAARMAAQQGTGAPELEFRVVHPDGSVHWLLARARGDRAYASGYRRLAGVLLDITETKTASARLAEALENLELATAGAGVGVYTRDLITGRGQWNAQTWRLFGLEPEDGAPAWTEILAAVHPDDRARYENVMKTISVDGQPRETEMRVVLADGSVRHLMNRGRAEMGTAGRVSRLYGVVLDITDRKEAESRLTEYAEWQRLMTRSIGIGLWSRDLIGDGAKWNDELKQLFDLAPEDEAPGFEQFLECVIPEDRHLPVGFRRQPPAPDQFVDYDVRVRRPNGALRILQTRVTTQRDAAGQPLRLIGATIDVTAAREASAMLDDALRRLELTGTGSAVGLFERTLDRNHAYWSPETYRLWGLTPSEQAPDWRQMLQLVHPDDRALFESNYERMYGSTAFTEWEFRVQQPSGRTVWLLVRGRLDPRAGANAQAPGNVGGVVLDVTASHEASKALAEARERLAMAAAAGGIASWERDLETGEGRWDPLMFRLFGIPEADTAPPLSRVIEMSHPDDRAPFLEDWHRIRNSTGIVEFDGRFVQPSGRVVHVTSRARAERRADGTPWRIIGATIDVTEWRRAKQQLGEALERLRLASEASDIGTWERDLDTGDAHWDATLFRLYGMASDDPTPTRDEAIAFTHPEDRALVAQAWQRIVESYESVAFEYRITRRDGVERHFHSRGRAMHRADGTPWRVLGVTLDVTDARRIEHEWRAANERLELATATAGIGIWERHAGTKTERWDARMREIYGISDPKWTPTKDAWLAFVHPDDRTRLPALFPGGSQGSNGGTFEYRIVRADGEERHVVENFTVERDAAGRIARVLGTNLDVTGIRAAERERDALADRMRLVSETAGVGVWDWDPVTPTSVWNDRMYQLLGHTRESFRDKTWIDAVHLDDAIATRVVMQDAVARGTEFDVQYRVVWPDGSVHWLESRGRVRRTDDGAVRVLEVSFDVTARHAAESAVRDLLERIQMTTAAAGIGLWEIEMPSGNISWDDQMYRLHGRTRAEMPELPRDWLAQVHADDRKRLIREALSAFRAPRAFEFEHRVVMPDGLIRWHAHRGYLQRDAGGRPLRQVGVTIDVTERRAAEEALRAKAAAERASQAKSDFLSRMSHELRTPLNAMLGFAQVLSLDSTTPLQPAQRERVDLIQQAGWHLLELINEVLDLARIEAGQARLALSMVPLAEVIDECLAMIGATALRRSIDVRSSVVAGAPPAAWADRTRVKQVLLNLLSNAVKYNRDGGQVFVTHDVNAAGNPVVAVRDTGRGMSASQVEKLFEPFNRLGLESSSIEGTGIGLALSLKLVEQMGGSLTVSSELGAGSELRMMLPAASHPPGSGAGDLLRAFGQDPALARDDVTGTVLYVEDNPSNVTLVQHLLLLRSNVRLFTAPDGATARVMAAVCQPDLILLDMRLPDVDGFTLLRELSAQRETEHIPCVGVSANAQPTDFAQARNAGFADYWPKPLDAHEFLRGIDALLARRET